MPADHGLRFHDDKDVGPTRPYPAQGDPEQPVQEIQSRARAFPLENGELLPQGEDLQSIVLPTAEEDSDNGEGSKDEFKHETLASTMHIIAPRCQPAENPKWLILLNDEVLTTHKPFRLKSLASRLP